MRTNIWRITSLVVLLAMLISPIGASGSANAAPSKSHTPASMPNGMTLVEAAKVGTLESLSAIGNQPIVADSPSYLKQNPERLTLPKALNGSDFSAPITLDAVLPNNMPATEANFEGVNNVSGVLPPDTDGDIGYDPITGKKYYSQWVNSAFQFWDVTDPANPAALLAAPVPGNILFTGLGGICEANNDGDPITLFDPIANRWFMSQFALGFPDDFHQCVAVSASADPMGAWYQYDYMTSDVMMNDYPKFGVWPDGYYMSVNQFDGATGDWGGAGVAVMERSQMLQGLPARMIYIDLGAVNLNYGGILPSDLDGPAPAYGTPNYFMEWDDSAWLGDPDDTLRIWEFQTDWVNPANTTFGANAAFDPNTMLATINVDLLPCVVANSRNCIEQPDTTQNLDALGDRLMFRLQYRDFGAYQTLVTNHTVDDGAGTGRAGVHWLELRDTGAGWALYQDDVFAPADTESRWMGSVAMDDSGNIALGYSVSSETVYPSIRYTGRLDADPLNDLPQGESTIIAGTGSQTHSAARWGDYSKMSVDPEDGCTFWYTQEYIETTSSADWQTRVGSFKFPSCTPLPTGTLSGTVTDGANPIAGVSVDVDSTYHTVTDASGNYEIELPDGTYSVVASKYGYVADSAAGVVITSPGVTDQDFTLTPAVSSTISGTVTDLGGGWPLYARIDIAGYPSSPIYTNPVSGQYTVALMGGSYIFTVVPLSGGYTPGGVPIVVAGDATHDFALAANLIACTAPGYEVAPAAFSENFETWPNTNGWTVIDNEGQGLVWDTNLFEGYPNWTGGAGQAAMANGDPSYFEGVEYDTELVSPVITQASLANLGLVYKANFITWGQTTLDLDIKNVGDPAWTNVSQWTGNHGTLYGLPGETVAVDLASFVTGDFQLRWHYYTPDTDPWDYYAQIDEVSIGAGCAPIPSAGLVVGNVYDENTGLTMPAADVVDGSSNQALFVDNSADPGVDSPLYIYAAPAGAVSLTASALGYGNDVQNPTVVSGSTIRQDFDLGAGLLSVAPTSMAFNTSTLAPTANQLATLTNAGGLGTDYEIFAIPGVFAGYTPTGPFAANTRHFGPKNLNDKDASEIRVPYSMPSVPAISAAGDVVTSWDTGLVYGWGIGYNTDLGDLWIGNIGAGGGDNLDHNFTTAGVATGDTIDMTPWVGSFGGDMTYNPFTNTLWQVNVGGDNCIYELDPASMVDTGNKICPLFGTSERGLAFDPITNTYYAGSWNDAIINHFAPDGTLLDAVDVGLPIAGLAYNPSTGHLFVSISYPTVSGGANDIYVLDAKNGYAVIGGIDIMDGGVRAIPDSSQKGIEMDCNGNLWLQVHATGVDKVVSFASGETGVCDWQASWLTTAPTSGNVAAHGSSDVNVNVDSTGMATGAYTAYLRVVNNTPYGDEIVPVTLNVGSAILTRTFKSVGAYDGWILESTNTSNVGGTLDKTATTFNLGDAALNRQYRAILHFNTSTLPDNAVITKVTLKIKRQGLMGTDPFTILGGLKVDMRKPFFGVNGGLVASDFQAAAGKSAVATFNATPASNWYSALLNATGRAYINKSGTTEFRLRFTTGDNHDNAADYMKFFSGNYGTVSVRPTLIIEYYVP